MLGLSRKIIDGVGVPFLGILPLIDPPLQGPLGDFCFINNVESIAIITQAVTPFYAAFVNYALKVVTASHFININNQGVVRITDITDVFSLPITSGSEFVLTNI